MSTHCDTNDQSRLGLVRVHQQAEIVIVDMQVRPEVACKRDGADQLPQPPHDLGARARVWCYDQHRLSEDKTLP